MVKKYPVLVFKDPATDWGVTLYDLPINLVDRSLEKALGELQGALEYYMEDEESLPEPTSIEEVVLSEYAKNASAIMLVDIDTSFFPGS